MKNILAPAYQPIYDLRNERVSHFEALARIRSDDTSKGHVELIQIAEKYRFMRWVDLTMMEMVLEEAGGHDHCIAVNVSPSSIVAAMDDFVRLFGRYRRRMPRLVIEITERPVQDISKLGHFVSVAKDLGASIALDDYGQSRGSFTAELVRLFKPHFLKLDGTVLDRAVFFDQTTELVQACGIAAEFGGQLIAEYVDSEQKIAYLRASGVRYAQGHYFGKPDRLAPYSIEFHAQRAKERRAEFPTSEVFVATSR